MKINSAFSNNPNQNIQSTQDILNHKIQSLIENDASIDKRTFQNIDTILKDLFAKTNNFQEISSKILQLLKQLPIFKSFDGLGKELNTLLDMLKNTNTDSKIKQEIKNIFLDLNKIDANILKNHVQKSGIFFESYLKKFSDSKIDSSQVFENTKSTLLLLGQSFDDEIKNQANKILSQIEYFALFSYLNNTNKIPLSLEWDDLKDGNIEFYKKSNELHTCTLNLHLELFGELKINFSYDEYKQLNIAFMCENESFKDIIQNNLPLAKQMLFESNLNLQSIGVHLLKNNLDLNKRFTNDTYNPYEVDIRV